MQWLTYTNKIQKSPLSPHVVKLLSWTFLLTIMSGLFSIFFFFKSSAVGLSFLNVFFSPLNSLWGLSPLLRLFSFLSSSSWSSAFSCSWWNPPLPPLPVPRPPLAALFPCSLFFSSTLSKSSSPSALTISSFLTGLGSWILIVSSSFLIYSGRFLLRSALSSFCFVKRVLRPPYLGLSFGASSLGASTIFFSSEIIYGLKIAGACLGSSSFNLSTLISCFLNVGFTDSLLAVVWPILALGYS